MSDGTEQIETLEMEVKDFANSLPYWGKYLCSKLLAGLVLSDPDIEAAYSYLSQDLELIEKTDNPVITLNYNENTSEDYKESLVINTLQNVEGVNALSENQTIEFSPDITIIYGANGSGKSGYVRLLKNVFYSKHKEEILTNIHEEENNKQISAEFSFLSDTTDISLKYPDHSSNGIFKQFSVFDGVVALRHLENRNVFEFRPSGLSLFSQFNGAIDALQHKLDSEIALISLNNPYAVIFEEQSAISQLIHSLSSSSDINDFKRHSSFTEKHALIKQKYDKKYDDLKILLSSKDEQIKLLEKVKDQIERVKQNLEGINSNFKQEYLDKIPDTITNCLEKQKIAKEEGIENFSSEEIQSIGSIEWKEFIKAAEKFALKQKYPIYPQIGDNCLLCHQPIKKEQQDLISSYWDFLKSVAEHDSKDALILIDKLKDVFQKIEFDQFPHDNKLTEWLKENFPDTLTNLLNNLTTQEELANIIIQNLESKQLDKYPSVQTDIKSLSEIELVIDSKIKNIQEGELSKELDKVLKPKTYLTHKQKLSDRIEEIEELYNRMLWVSKANNFNKQYWKGNTTRTE
jgi:predicted ATPase